MLKKLIIGLAAVAALALATTTALAAVGVKADYSFSPNKAKKSAGVSVNIVSSDPAAEQPPIMNRIQITFPSGGKWNGPKFPKCSHLRTERQGPQGLSFEVEDRLGHRSRLREAGRDGSRERCAHDLQRRQPDPGVRVPGPRSDVRDALQDQGRLQPGLLDPADQDAAERA